MFIVKPSEPKNLVIVDQGSDFVKIKWEPPDTIGVPTLTKYSVLLDAHMSTQEIQTNDTTLSVHNLLPGREYKITVKGISDYFTNGGDASTVSFKTDYLSKLSTLR